MTLNLLKYTREGKDLFYTLDLKETEEYADNLGLGVTLMQLEEFFLDYLEPRKKELIKLYSEKNNLERIAFLSAKGLSKDNNWHFANQGEIIPIQKWINENDGKYKLLILNVDNLNQDEICSRKSIVMAPYSKVSLNILETGFPNTELFVPKTGYLDVYSIDSELEKLRK